MTDRSRPDPAHAEGPTRDEQEREVKEARRELAGEDPHGDLSNPVRDPDPTVYPDPYEKRPDPRDPAAVDTPAHPADRDPADDPPQDPSTSDPHPPRNVDRDHYEGSER
jgi:hypothetical protein